MNTSIMQSTGDPSELLRDELYARAERTGDRVARAAAVRLDNAWFEWMYTLPYSHDPITHERNLRDLNRAHATGLRALARNARLREVCADASDFRR